jgi:hypothetical protein
MNHEQAIRYACLIQALVTRTIGDYSVPNDGFCDHCPNKGETFQSSGQSASYVLDAVIEKLRRDGHEPDAAVMSLVPEVEQQCGIAARPPLVVDPADVSTLVTTVHKANGVGVIPNMIIRATEPIPDLRTPAWVQEAQDIHDRAGRRVAEALWQHLPGGTVDQVLRALLERRASLLSVRF